MGSVIGGQISVYAYPGAHASPNFGMSASEPTLGDEVRDAGVYFVVEYETQDELLDQIIGILDGLKQKPSLGILEIHAHGDPSGIDGFGSAYPSDLARFGRLRWSDNSRLYLTGCNTGLTDATANDPGWGAVSVAQVWANALPLQPKQFRFTVFGTVGYSNGCHALGTTATSEIYRFRPFFDYGPFTGGRDTKPDPALSDPAAGAYAWFRGPNSA
jgi:hypothetical protein